LGVGVGQLPPELRSAKLFESGRIFGSGLVLSGNAFHQLTRMLSSSGWEWMIQHNELIVVRHGTTIRGDAVLLTPETGLIGSPEPGGDGRVVARSLLQPAIVPGRQVRFERASVTGYYRVETVVYDGDTSGLNRYADFDAKELGTK